MPWPGHVGERIVWVTRPLPVFAYSIAADQHRPSEGEGFVRAETIQQAVALVGHPEVNVYELPADAVCFLTVNAYPVEVIAARFAHLGEELAS